MEIMIITHDGIKYESAKAVLFIFDDENVWIPKTVITEYDDTTVNVQQWFAEKEGLEVYESQ